MTTTPRDRLYRLLPAIYALRDAERGQPLRALLGVLDDEVAAIEEDIFLLYDSWFIETCPDWAVPYIGDLLGVQNLHGLASSGVNPRSYVANALKYRRSKGTPRMLTQLLRDVTDWPARPVEYRQLVATTQHLLLPRPANAVTFDVRNAALRRRLRGPFEAVPRTVDLRSMASGLGRQNLPNLGLFLWRLRAFPLTGAAAAAAVDPARGLPYGDRFFFNPRGLDMQLFGPDRSDPGRPLTESDAPDVLHTDVLAAVWSVPEQRARYLARPPIWELTPGDSPTKTPLGAEELAPCDLDKWSPPWDKLRQRYGAKVRVALDPERGRFMIDKAQFTPNAPVSFAVSYFYGFSSELGGGGYDRSSSLSFTSVDLQAPIVSVDRSKGPDALAAAVQTAADLHKKTGAATVVIQFEDSWTYRWPAQLTVPEDTWLIVRARNGQRPLLQLTSGAVALTKGRLTLDGLFIEGGQLSIADTGGAVLELRHCTVALGTTQPGGLGLAVSTLQAERCILGNLTASGTLGFTDCILDHWGKAEACVAATATAQLLRCTVFGNLTLNQLTLASDCVFTGVVQVTRPGSGCVRYCYVSDQAGAMPPRFHCQPDLAVSAAADSSPDALQRLRLSLMPVFTSTRLGDAGYAQLSASCAEAVRRGSSAEDELGAFAHLHQLLREANLRTSLQDAIPVGFETGVFFVS